MACSILLSIATALVPDALKGKKEKTRQNQIMFFDNNKKTNSKGA
jgi:hypothetical protein